MISYKPAFSRALGTGERLHVSAHSHHLWPDVSFEGQRRAWEDAAELWDGKWRRIMGEVVPEAQGHIARHLGLRDPAAIAFAPNTHELFMRVLSVLPAHIRVLTTDGEFHSFTRQMARLAEEGRAAMEVVPTEPFDTFAERFAARARAGGHDLVYLSQVFFNSGFAVEDVPAIVAAVPDPRTIVMIDGYHGFMARPTDLAPVQDRAFYLGGGYKYVMAGEGACFMACPAGYVARPVDTGWFAGFDTLAAHGAAVGYASGGARFWSGTFDPTGLYRFNAVMRWLAGIGVDAGTVAARVAALQADFVARLEACGIAGLRRGDLVVEGLPRGNFLAYRSPRAPELCTRLEAGGIVADHRRDVLRIGFGLYHDLADMPVLVERMRAILA